MGFQLSDHNGVDLYLLHALALLLMLLTDVLCKKTDEFD